MNQYDTIIIGAGISGLSMAHYCAVRNLKTLVLEKSDRIGGALHSHRRDHDGKTFWIEMGAHSCFNSYGHLLEIMENHQLLAKLIKKRTSTFKLLVGRQMKSIPLQLNYLELLVSLPRLLTQKKPGMSVADYYSRIFGEQNYQKLFSPAFNAVICQQADAFPAELLFRSKPRRKDVIRSFTLPDGIQHITDTVARPTRLDLLRGKEVKAMAYREAAFTLRTADDAEFTAPYLVIATPVSTASQLLVNCFPVIAEQLAQIPTVTVDSLGIIIPKDAVKLPPLAGIIATDDAFFSAVSRDTVPHPIYRGFTFHFKPGRCDQNAKIQRICDVLGIRRQRITETFAKQNTLPALNIGHNELIARIDEQLNGKPLGLAGNYFTGVSIEECVSRSRNEALRLF